MIELKLKNSRAIANRDIVSVFDLYNAHCLDELFQYLIDQVSDLYIVDSVEPLEANTTADLALQNTFTSYHRYSAYTRSERTTKSKNLKKYHALLKKYELETCKMRSYNNSK